MRPIAHLSLPSVAFFALCTITMNVAAAAPPAMNSLPAASSSSAGPSPTSLIDINSATLTHLLTLPGVGTVTARAIVEGRPYASVDDLKARKVVSSKTFEKIRGQIRVKSSASAAAGERTNTSAPGTATH